MSCLSIFLPLLATGALWVDMGQHGFGSGQMAVWEVGPFRTEDHACFVPAWTEASKCDAGEMVFFTPS